MLNLYSCGGTLFYEFNQILFLILWIPSTGACSCSPLSQYLDALHQWFPSTLFPRYRSVMIIAAHMHFCVPKFPWAHFQLFYCAYHNCITLMRHIMCGVFNWTLSTHNLVQIRSDHVILGILVQPQSKHPLSVTKLDTNNWRSGITLGPLSYNIQQMPHR